MQTSRVCRLSYRVEVGPGPAEDSLFQSCWYSLSKHSKQLVSSRWISSPVNRYRQPCFQCLTSLCPCPMPIIIHFQKLSFSFSIFFWAARFCGCFFFGRRNVLFLPTIFWRKTNDSRIPKISPSLQSSSLLFYFSGEKQSREKWRIWKQNHTWFWKQKPINQPTKKKKIPFEIKMKLFLHIFV